MMSIQVAKQISSLLMTAQPDIHLNWMWEQDGAGQAEQTHVPLGRWL